MVKTMDRIVERPLRERFHLMAENSEDGIAIIQGGRIVCMNDRLCNLFGYSADELTDMSPLDLVAPEERERLRETLQQVQESEQPSKELAYWALRKDGSRRYVRQRFSSDYDSDGVPSRFVVVSDLTTQELAQQVLADQEDFLQRVMKASQALTAADDPEATLRAIVEPAMEAGAHAALLLMLDGDAGGQPEWAEAAAVCGAAKAPLGTRFYLPDSPQASLLLSSPGRPIMIPDLDVTAQAVKEEIARMMGVEDVRALAVLPLQTGQQWQGVATIAWPEPHEFSPRDGQLFGVVSPYLASSLKVQRLQKEAEHRAGRRRTTSEVPQAAVDPEHSAPEENRALPDSASEQGARAPEDTRLFDEEQRARTLLAMRDGQMDCLNDIGLKIDETPPLAELFQWVAERIPSAMQYPALCRVAIEFQGQSYGAPEVMELPCQAMQSIRAGHAVAGKLCVSYTEELNLLDEEQALLGDIARRLGGYIENRRLLEKAHRYLQELAMLFEVSQALAGAPLRRDEITGTVIRQFIKMMGIPEASISLHDPETGLLNVMADLHVGQEGIRPVREPEVFRLSDYPATEHVIKTLQPLVVQASDPNADPAELAFMQPRGIMTLIILPLAVKGEAVGIVELESTEREVHYTPEDLNLAMTLANQAAVALESTRLFEQAQAALAEVQATHRSYLRQMWQEHLHQRRVLERSGFVFDQRQTDSPGNLIAIDDLWRPEIELAVAEGEPIVTQDGDGGQERTSLAIPITVRGQTLGVIGVEASTGDREWTRDEIALVQAVSEQLGQALESARLFADARRTAERERLIGEITAKIRSSADVQAILETTAAELGQVLGASRALVRLASGEPEANRQPPQTRTAKPLERGQHPAAEGQR
jgi:PAS domain S-box-containing protein